VEDNIQLSSVEEKVFGGAGTRALGLSHCRKRLFLAARDFLVKPIKR
jgi:hypothetical protein